MIFTETKLTGVFIVELERYEDERGFFAQSWTQRDFAARGLDSRLVECNISYNKKRGTLRGMHFQLAPYSQGKLVRCTAGAIYDVAIDLRPGSPTFKEWTAVELTAENRIMLFVPGGFAHGYQTLVDHAEVLYQATNVYAPEYAGGVCWDDPAFNICWPDVGERTINERDRTFPPFAL